MLALASFVNGRPMVVRLR